MNSQYYKSLGAILIACFFAACMQEDISQYNYCPKEDIILQHFAGAANPTQLEEFLKENPDVDPNACCSEHKYTALMKAVLKGEEKSVDTLFEVLGDRINVNKQNEDGDTALILAAKQGDTEMVGNLLEREGIDVNLTNLEGYTALSVTVMFFQYQGLNDTQDFRGIQNAGLIGEKLKEKNANLGIEANEGTTIFHKFLDRKDLTPEDVAKILKCVDHMKPEEKQALLAYIEQKKQKGGIKEIASKTASKLVRSMLSRSKKGKEEKQGGTSTRPKKLVKQSPIKDIVGTPNQGLHSRGSRKRLGSKPGVESYSGSTKKKKPKKTNLLEKIKAALQSDDLPDMQPQA